MKKYLSILVMGLALTVLPISANAAEVQVNFTCDKQCVDTGDMCQSTCNISLSGDNVAVTNLKAALELSEGLTIASVNAKEPFSNMSVGTNLEFQSLTSTSGTNVPVATVVINVPKNAVNCKITLKPTGFANKTVEIKQEQPVKTGANLPLVIIACGALAAGAVYVVSKKNTKLYKI